jgi:hypothetical protein
VKELTARDWLKRDYWTLLEAFCLIRFGVSPEHMVAMNPKLGPLYDLPDFDLVRRSIMSGALEVLNPELKDGKSVQGHMLTVKPLDFLRWCWGKEISLSERVTAILTEEERLYIRGEEEEHVFQNINQRHKERCRAVAACIWKREPHLTIEDIIQHDDINDIACENRIYSAKTLREWIKDLCPNRQPGRRPSQPSN